MKKFSGMKKFSPEELGFIEEMETEVVQRQGGTFPITLTIEVDSDEDIDLNINVKEAF